MNDELTRRLVSFGIGYLLSLPYLYFILGLRQYLPKAQWRILFLASSFLLVSQGVAINFTVREVYGLEPKRIELMKPQQSIIDLPILLSVYDTALCEPNTPCLQGDGDGYFATMLPVSGEWYGKMAACPPELLGATIVIPYLEMEVYCGDNFGLLNGVPVETAMWGKDGFIRVDVFWPVASQGLPSWNYWQISGWYVEWRN